MTTDSRPALRPGDPAPDFTLPDQFGESVTLSQLVGVKPVVLAFVPAAFTRTCTGEFCELQENLSMFQDASVDPFGISTDPKAALRVWAAQESLQFPLLSDFWPHGEVASSYGVFLPDLGIATRATFVVDATMTIRSALVNSPRDARTIAEYQDALRTL